MNEDKNASLINHYFHRGAFSAVASAFGNAAVHVDFRVHEQIHGRNDGTMLSKRMIDIVEAVGALCRCDRKSHILSHRPQ